MAKSQQFKATVNFGARIDPSFGAAVSAIGDSMSDAAKDAAAEVNKLTKQQERLRKRIEEATRAGRDVSRLTAKYNELSGSIDTASRSLARLNRLGRTATNIGNAGRMAAFAGRTGMAVARPALMGAGVVTGLAAGTIALNAQTAEEFGQAKSYGLDISTYKAMGGIAKMAGLNAENMGDLVEEMKNKVGEVGNEKMMNELLPQIGLNKAQLLKATKADPQKAFADVMQRLTQGVKEGKISAVEAQSFADQLMGGEANKILTFMHEMNMTYEEALKEQKKYNLLTEEGAKGAMVGSHAINNLWSVATTGMQDVVGKITNELAPDINTAAEDLAVWAKEVTPEITKAVTDWIRPDESGKRGPERLWGAITDAGESLTRFGKIVMTIADKLSWIIPDAPRQAEEAGSEFEARALGKEQGIVEAEKLGYGILSSERREYIRKRMDDYGNAWSRRHETRVADRYTIDGDTGTVPMYGTIDVPDFRPQNREIIQPTVTNNSTHVAPVINIYPQPGQTGDMVKNELNQLFPEANAPTYDSY
ncbi:hypothetical protein RVW00_000751 [Enterobacter bugandensis]|nr:hypothetical protein [Enterobacter bugandensis]